MLPVIRAGSLRGNKLAAIFEQVKKMTDPETFQKVTAKIEEHIRISQRMGRLGIPLRLLAKDLAQIVGRDTWRAARAAAAAKRGLRQALPSDSDDDSDSGPLSDSDIESDYTLQNEVARMQEQIRQMQKNMTSLEAKVRELERHQRKRQRE